MLQGKVLKIWNSQKVVSNKEGEPGEIIGIEDDGFIVKTGNNIAIKAIEIQPAGKKKMTSLDFLRGAGSQLTVGEKLGAENE